ncbi:MAG TPA: ATP-binding protein [Blastocatellia bacterium]|nr:ATP-binding protein [Blastocatellia bacterium]
MKNPEQMSGESKLSESGRKRLTKVIVLSILVIVLLLILVAQSFNLSALVSPDTASETLLLYALSTLNFFAFITVFFVLLRNILKLVRERRANRLGSKFKTRFVAYAIGLSLLPALLLFFFAYGLLNLSIDRWFGEPARQIVDDAQAVVDEGYFKQAQLDLAVNARSIAAVLSLSTRADLESSKLQSQLREKLDEYRLAFLRISSRGRSMTILRSGQPMPQYLEAALDLADEEILSGADTYANREYGEQPSTIYVLSGVRLDSPDRDARALILARTAPPELTQPLANIAAQHENFYRLRGGIKRIKALYIMLLSAVTLLLIFAASWLALWVARGITVPIQALAEATERVAHGDLDYRVKVVAEDELAVLVNSFNQMAAQLRENRERLECAAEELSRTNTALDDRRRYIETVLESLSTGVISADEGAGIATINRAAIFMLGLPEKPEIGTPVKRLIDGPQGDALMALCRRARRSDLAQAEIEFKRPNGSSLHTATTAIALKSSEGVLEGWVIVIEDLTDLIQAERAAAWSEVARRMAHEIKNPLTPIQLSAERIMRNYKRAGMPAFEPRFDEVVKEGTATIVREVAALQRMVEEFSRFARLPEARRIDCSLNEVVRDAVSLYDERLDGVRIECRLADELPILKLDAEQIKRVCVNLIDNALEALGRNGSGNGHGPQGENGAKAGPAEEGLILIESRWIKSNDTVRLMVADTGHGIRPADRDKLFLPKFSTRDRGTGLGLAIVSHIIADHKGRIWIEDTYPRGARFIIELPSGERNG